MVFQVSMHASVEPNQMPDVLGHFGPYGGVFVPETLMPAVCELKDEYERARQDPQFKLELDRLLRSFCGRPTPLLCRAPHGEAEGTADLPEKGRPSPYRCA